MAAGARRGPRDRGRRAAAAGQARAAGHRLWVGPARLHTYARRVGRANRARLRGRRLLRGRTRPDLRSGDRAVTPLFPTSAIVRASERLVLGGGRWTRLDIPIRYGLWLHQRFGPVLIDTGYAPRVTSDARRSLGLKLYNALLRPRLIEMDAPLQRLRALGLGPGDVTRIVVTHFHADHVAGLGDFPNARILASADAFSRLSRMSKLQQLHNAYYPELVPADFAVRLMPIEDCRTVALPHNLGRGFDLFDDGSLLAVPLPGHALGHHGLLWPELPLLYAVDAQWLLQAIMDRRLPEGPARLIYADEAEVSASCEKVRSFALTGGRVVLCHDPQPVDFPAGQAGG